MSETDKPVELIHPTECDFVGYAEGDTGVVVIGFVLPGRVDIDIHLTPEVLASLEAKLSMVREGQAASRPLQ